MNGSRKGTEGPRQYARAHLRGLVRCPQGHRRLLLKPAAACAALTALLIAAGAPAGTGDSSQLAVLVDATPLPAALVRVDQDWTVTFEADHQRRRIPAVDLVVWGAPVPARRGAHVLAADGSLLLATAVHSVDGQLRIDTAIGGHVVVPRQAVCGILYQPPADRLQRDRLATAACSGQRDTDQMFLTNDDIVTGAVTEIHNGQVSLQTEVGRIQVDTDRIGHLLFRSPPVETTDGHGLSALVGLRDGTLVHARSLVATAVSVQAVLSCGGQLTGGKPADLVCLQPLGGRVVYVSDLPVDSYRHVPYLTLSWPFRADRSVLDGRLCSQGRLYNKGLGMHSASRIAFQLDSAYRRFDAEVAIDDQARGQGSARFRVLTKTDGTWKEAYASRTVRGGDDPVPVSVDLAGADAIRLLVDFADRGDELDHADWLSARLVK